MSANNDDRSGKESLLESLGVEDRWLRITLRCAGWLFVFPLLCLIFFRITFVNYVENYQLAYLFDTRTGKIDVLPRTGYFVTWPFIQKVNYVDLRPMQVCISAIQRVLNCKLVQFNPDAEHGYDGLRLFLSWHGRQDYDGPDQSSSGGASSYTYFQSVLLNYAYDGSGKTYPFLTVLRELKNQEGTSK